MTGNIQRAREHDANISKTNDSLFGTTKPCVWCKLPITCQWADCDIGHNCRIGEGCKV